MRSGERFPSTGEYRSTCVCRSLTLAREGEIAPLCLKCRKSVMWMFQRAAEFGGQSALPRVEPAGRRGVPGEAHRVLLVEDDPVHARRLEEHLLPSDLPRLQVDHCARLSDALIAARQTVYGVVLLDLGLPDSEGLETVSRMRETASVPIIALTEDGEEALGELAMQRGVRACFSKEQGTRDELRRAVALAMATTGSPPSGLGGGSADGAARRKIARPSDA